MKKTIIVYGSTTGNTETVANLIAGKLEGAQVANVADVNKDDIAAAELVLFGSSTWGYGDLQDDWESFIDELSSDMLSGKDVAVFGCGDQDGFGDVFCEATETIRSKAEECGANIVAENLKVDGEPSDSEDAIAAFAAQFA